MLRLVGPQNLKMFTKHYHFEMFSVFAFYITSVCKKLGFTEMRLTLLTKRYQFESNSLLPWCFISAFYKLEFQRHIFWLNLENRTILRRNGFVWNVPWEPQTTRIAVNTFRLQVFARNKAKKDSGNFPEANFLKFFSSFWMQLIVLT